MTYLWKAFGIPEPKTEFKFHPTRKWKFDYCWPDKKIAVEIEGAAWTQGRHTRGGGFIADMTKYNAAGKLGWKIFRFTPQELKRGIVMDFMKDLL